MEATKRFYWSKKWKKVQANYKKQAGGLCERCLKRGLYVPGVIVHHKIHITPENMSDDSITCNPDNLELVCRDCHALLHKTQRRYKLDDLGRVTVLE